MTVSAVVVLGGGVAGCAAAVAAAQAGATVTLIEASRQLGGVAVVGEHRTICGLAPIDAPTPELLEPTLTSTWVRALATGTPVRTGRVWLWPTSAEALARGLRTTVHASQIEMRLGAVAKAIEAPRPGRSGYVRLAGAGRSELPFAALIDASGGGTVARWLGLRCTTAMQWGSVRCWVRLPTGWDPADPAARLAWLGRLTNALGTPGAVALTGWQEEVGSSSSTRVGQISLDISPGTTAAIAQVMLERALVTVGATVLGATWQVAARDEGRAEGALDLTTLFATQERGLCWAAWPREEHTPTGVRWTWPPRDRYGVPPSAVRMAGAPDWWWCIGKGMPVTPVAASALRVIGTGLSIGGAVGAAVARHLQVPEVHGTSCRHLSAGIGG